MSENKIHWLGHASIKIEGEKTIYIDPWKIHGEPVPADIILITHSHYDHCSKNDIEMIRRKDTVIIAPPDCRDALPPGFIKCEPGMEKEINGVLIKAVPAYNIDKNFHPRRNNWVGYLIEMGGDKIYVAGDTDYIPEMADINADIAIVPVGGTYTMTSEEAARAVQLIAPRLAIPIHYGSIVGSASDAEKFKKLSVCQVEILPEE